MKIHPKPPVALSLIALTSAVLMGCTVTSSPQVIATPSVTPTATPAPDYITVLPDWARETGGLWLVYPDGMECPGTEGCPNDFRAFFGEPGPVLPGGVEYYEPVKHDCRSVIPVGVDCNR